MTHTVDTLMALADGYANSYMTFHEKGMREALLTALTESLQKHDESIDYLTRQCEKYAGQAAQPKGLFIDMIAEQGPEFVAEMAKICVQHDCDECKAKAAQPLRHELRPWEKAVLAPPHPGHFGIPKEHWETAQNYANFWHNNRLEAIRVKQEAAQPVREPLSEERIIELGHRMATKYTHRSDPTSHAYGFVKHTLVDFVRAIERENGIGCDK